MKIWIYILLLGLLAACSDEEKLTPPEVKNWYVITPTENMDEVDQKIYDIYTEHNLAVFYKDTIGSEDRGWKDENGNPKLYYEVLRLDYDMTTNNVLTNKFKATPLDVSTPEKKAEIMPLLNLMDEKLFPWIENAQVFIPAILVVESMRKGYSDTYEGEPYYVYRGTGVLGFAMDSYDQSNADSLIQKCFLQQICHGAMQDILESFQAIVIEALKASISSNLNFDAAWGADVDDFIPGYSDKRGQFESMEKDKKRVIQLSNRNDEIIARLTDETLTDEEKQDLQTEYDENLLLIESLNEGLTDYEEYSSFVFQHDPRNYGLLEYVVNPGESTYKIPTTEEDFNIFLEAFWKYDEEEFEEICNDYVYAQARYTLMKQTLESIGINIAEIRADLNE